MKISVIVPVYNVEPILLKACFRSLRMQSLHSENYEVIVVDDASTQPSTLAVLKSAALGPNFRVERHSENLGLNEARRTGVRVACGDYVVFVDGDDLLTRDGLELFRMEAHRTKADIVTSWFKRWHIATKKLSDLTILRRELASDPTKRMEAVFRCNHSYTMCGRLFSASLLTEEVFDMGERVYHEDLITLPRLVAKARTISAVKKNVYYYTENETSITSVFSTKHARDFFYAFSDWQRLATQIGGLDFSNAIKEGVEKLTSTLVRRCQLADNLSVEEKDSALDYIENKLSEFGVTESSTNNTVIKSLFKFNELKHHAGPREVNQRWKQVFAELDRQKEANKPTQVNKPRALSDMAMRLKDKIVLIGQVDYQIKNAALAARELRKRGHACVVLDNSGFVAGGKRKFQSKNRGLFWRTEHIKIPSGPYQTDWLATAKAVITFNDFNDDIREALEFRQLLGMPTICAVEGINDFTRIDFRRSDGDPYRFLPYRRCDTVFLAGENDKKFFSDRDIRIVGMPIVEELQKKKPSFPKTPVAALNLNFTYGVLEDKREEFLRAAVRGLQAAGFEFQITQHPMDNAVLGQLKASTKTQYELIDETSVFVSRFATGILEALASGKPAIYFNPHGEKVEKFKDPLGAFDVANTPEELEAALHKVEADIADGVDFRKRACSFLSEHTNFQVRGKTVSEQFADAVIDVLNKAGEEPAKMHDLFFERLEVDAPFRIETPNQVFGEFQRGHKAQLNDEEMLARFFGDDCSVMIDVGANFGNSCDVYLGKGWTVHAFEPDPYNRSKLLEVWPNDPKLIVNTEAVDDKGGQELSFFASDESTGISGLSAFTKGHKEVCKVQTTTLRDYYKTAGLKHIDFLKVDVEGFDKFVLDGFPWEIDRPEVVLAEFEDNKTLPLGYTIHDLAKVMEDNGYTVYVSEWHPIVRYGIAHDWRRFLKYTSKLKLGETWGNLIGFKNDPGIDQLRQMVKDTLKFSVPLSWPQEAQNKAAPVKDTQSLKRNLVAPAASAATTMPPQPLGKTVHAEPPIYAAFGNWVREVSPKLFRFLQIARRGSVGMWRRKTLIAPSVVLAGVTAWLSTLQPLAILQTPFVLLLGLMFLGVGFVYLAYLTYEYISAMTTELHALRASIKSSEAQKSRAEKLQNEVFKAKISLGDLEAQLARTMDQLDQTGNELDTLRIGESKLEKQVSQTIERVQTSERAIEAISESTQLLNKRTDGLSGQKEQILTKLDITSQSIKSLASRALVVENRARSNMYRAGAADRQISAIRYNDSPQCFVFLGHHKCGSRFFRNEVFRRIAETYEAETLRYEIKSPPFHFSQLDELDLANINFDRLNAPGRHVVLFANASPKSVEALDTYVTNWRGIRLIRDPRQVLVSGYVHHKGKHPVDPDWVWDQLAEDKPILRELSDEAGILYELDHISKQVIEEHVLAGFEDDRISTIRLEDFAAAPSEHLKSISQHLRIADLSGLDFERTFANSDSKPWQVMFTSKIRKVFKDRYGEALIKLGYEKDLFW